MIDIKDCLVRLFRSTFFNILSVFDEIIQWRRKNPSQPYESAAINTLISTLPSIDSQRQYPLRLKPFFDFADVPGNSLGEKADHFVQRVKENPQWANDILVNFVNHCKQSEHKKRSCCWDSAYCF